MHSPLRGDPGTTRGQDSRNAGRKGNPVDSKIALASPLAFPLRTLCLVATLSAPAAAEDRSTCERLRAEARAEAALLYAPRIVVEGARVPGVVSGTEVGETPGDGVQGRIALAVSPVDMLRGRATERLALAECVLDEVTARVGEVLELGTRHGELEATRAELSSLESRIGELDTLVAEALDRFARQRTLRRMPSLRSS